MSYCNRQSMVDQFLISSTYKSLKTNLPREVMSFTDFEFSEKAYGDPRMYPGHEEVLMFLTDFATHFELTELSRFNTFGDPSGGC
ncbi:putative flavin monooxygenase, FAD/NAD(P)-binding domain superfamily [Helianthus debilis subsp. tardiflorus]